MPAGSATSSATSWRRVRKPPPPPCLALRRRARQGARASTRRPRAQRHAWRARRACPWRAPRWHRAAA
eukprot:6172136-Pleurochrysis_carterae.AAC.1